MSDVIVVSQQTSPPSIYVTPTLIDQLTSWKSAILTAGIWAKLFINNITVSASTDLADLSEAVAPGYAPISVNAIDGPYLDGSNNAYMSTPKLNFTTTGGGTDLVYGCYVVEQIGAAASATFTGVSGEYTAPVITPNTVPYAVPPRITPTGASGSGAVFTGVLTAGILTGITINNPGSGYTTFTVNIEPPTKLIEVANFPAPEPLQNVTDAVQVVIELDNLAA